MRGPFPWLKLQKDTKRNPVIRKMPLAHQAVFYNLLQHAGLQFEEGAFDDTDREVLALEVAGEDEDALAATIDHLLRFGVLIRLEDGRLAFESYEDNQASPAEINAARQRSFYKRRSRQDASDDLTAPNGALQNLTVDREVEVDVEEEIDKERDAGIVAREENDTSSIVAALGVEGDEEAEGAIAAVVESRSDLNHTAEAQACRLEYPDWPKWSRRERAKRYVKWISRAYVQQPATARGSPEGQFESSPLFQPTPEDIARVERQYAADERARQKRERQAAEQSTPTR